MRYILDNSAGLGLAGSLALNAKFSRFAAIDEGFISEFLLPARAGADVLSPGKGAAL